MKDDIESQVTALRSVSGTLRNASLLTITFLLYLALVGMTSGDEVFIANDGVLEIPLVKVPASPRGFYVASCLIGAALVLYVRMLVERGRKLAGELVATRRGAGAISELVDPWVVSLLSIPTQDDISHRLSMLPRLLMYWLPMVAIALVAWRAAAAPRWALFLICLSATATWIFASSPFDSRRRIARINKFVAALLILVAVSRRVAWEWLGPFWPFGLEHARLSGAQIGSRDFQRTNLFRANLDGAVLVGANLSRAYLHEAHAEKADLRRVNAVESWMPEVILDGADLRGARFDGAGLYDASFVGAKLRRTSLRRTRVQDATFDAADMEQVVFDDAWGAWARFTGARVANSSWKGSVFPCADFTDVEAWKMKARHANFARALFQDANLEESAFIRSDLRGARFIGKPILTAALFEECDMDGAQFGVAWRTKFRRSSLERAQFRKANASEAHFVASNLRGVDFTEAELFKASFANSALGQSKIKARPSMITTFRKAKVSRALFKGVDAADVSFEEADLYRTEFNNSSLHGTNLKRADLTHAVFTEVRGQMLVAGACLENADLSGVVSAPVDFCESRGVPARLSAALKKHLEQGDSKGCAGWAEAQENILPETSCKKLR